MPLITSFPRATSTSTIRASSTNLAIPSLTAQLKHIAEEKAYQNRHIRELKREQAQATEFLQAVEKSQKFSWAEAAFYEDHIAKGDDVAFFKFRLQKLHEKLDELSRSFSKAQTALSRIGSSIWWAQRKVARLEDKERVLRDLISREQDKVVIKRADPIIVVDKEEEYVHVLYDGQGHPIDEHGRIIVPEPRPKHRYYDAWGVPVKFVDPETHLEVTEDTINEANEKEKEKNGGKTGSPVLN